MALKVLGISDLYVSRKPGDVLITYSLGSCIGLTVYDPVAKIGGMIHYMLPLSKLAPEKARAKPGMFADTGVPLLLKKVIELGAAKDRLIVKVAGGSELMDQNKVFNIGERNYLVLRKLLWKNNILITAEDVGGNFSRTLRLEINTGYTSIKTREGEREL
ncbi:MAG: chemotaxis protein CheD [Candidatus Zixiibacteriota bacterium]|nr:MAG: chemotaxis protein CheD [candidate division Zixibacteria bacterium]HHI02254.1 chemotaxis protein CheD [candidate division Zixibacteria bacterium]